MQTASINIRTNEKLKKRADKLYSALGLNMSVAINMFLAESVRTNSLPLKLRLEPNDETIKAINEAKEIEKHPNMYKGYKTVDEFMEAMLS